MSKPNMFIAQWAQATVDSILISRWMNTAQWALYPWFQLLRFLCKVVASDWCWRFERSAEFKWCTWSGLGKLNLPHHASCSQWWTQVCSSYFGQIQPSHIASIRSHGKSSDRFEDRRIGSKTLRCYSRPRTVSACQAYDRCQVQTSELESRHTPYAPEMNDLLWTLKSIKNKPLNKLFNKVSVCSGSTNADRSQLKLQWKEQLSNWILLVPVFNFGGLKAARVWWGSVCRSREVWIDHPPLKHISGGRMDGVHFQSRNFYIQLLQLG